MIAARRRALVLTSVVLIAAAAVALGFVLTKPSPLPPRASSERPPLLLLTSLPLFFGEEFSLQGGGSAVMKTLDSRYRVIPISVTDPPELAKGRILLMAQPLAQPAEDLVALDDWVRRGGRVLLLADPLLEWPSKRPLGDPLRPPAMFMDTGLLAHWGLRLDAPDEPGPELARMGGYEIMTLSRGKLFGSCAISEDRLVAHCRVGRGQATVVADADLLDTERLDQSRHNFDALLAELARMESRVAK